MSDARSSGIDEARRRAFESSWIEGRPEAIERHLPEPESSSYLPTLEELVLIELEFAWKRCAHQVAAGRGSFVDAPRVEAYLERFPGLEVPEIVARLAAEEYRIRQGAGDRPAASEYRTRFPGLDAATQVTEVIVGGPELPAAEVPSSAAFAERYVLMAEYARGGMGAVWRASDRKLGREVAVKQLSESLAGQGDFRRRFLTEARVTAGLEHPGIVPVYDLSGPGDEHDCYAMKLVRGETLAAAIDSFHQLADGAAERPLERRRLFDAFLTVCRTMEYAHAQGVIHRDLKPQNILLGNYGETIVLDWGLAKEVGDKSAPAAPATDAAPGSAEPITEGTQPGTIQGTPAYMAPEQAAGRTDEVDERTDVYALGVILYQILTGTLPFYAQETEDLLKRVIAGRFVRPRAIDPGIPRALEAICRTAMACDRDERYERVADLTRDLQRHLADEPVSVWTEPWQVRTRRWMRRHRTAVTGIAAAVGVALIGLTVVAFVLTAANRRLEVANARERAARQAEAEQRQQAEANFAIARDAVDRYFTQVSEDVRLRARGLEKLRRDLLGSARDFYARLVEQRADDPALELERGHTLIRLAMITNEVGERAEAVKLLARARDLFTDLGAQRPDDPFITLQTARIENRLGGVHLNAGRVADAEQHLSACLEILEELPLDAPCMSGADTCAATALQNLAGVYRSTRRLGEAEKTYLQARKVQTRRVEAAPEDAKQRHVLATIRLNLAMVIGARGRAEEAAKEAEAALALAESLVKAEPTEPVYATLQAKIQSDLGVCYRQAGRLADARATYERAVAARDALARTHPDVPSYAYDAAQTRLNLANLMLSEGRNDEARALMGEVVEACEALTLRAPEDMRSAMLLVTAHFNLGAMLHGAQLARPAEEHYAQAGEVGAKTVARYPAAVGIALRAAESFVQAGDMAAWRGDRAVAATHFQSAVAVLEACGAAALEQPPVKARLAEARDRLAKLRRDDEEGR